jgi:hypothetical protein
MRRQDIQRSEYLVQYLDHKQCALVCSLSFGCCLAGNVIFAIKSCIDIRNTFLNTHVACGLQVYSYIHTIMNGGSHACSHDRSDAT